VAWSCFPRRCLGAPAASECAPVRAPRLYASGFGLRL
jgi:hypothetical protein